MELDTFLTEVYCTVDDMVKEIAHLKPSVGRPAVMSDSEVITLALLAQWQHGASERAFLERTRRDWRAFFPRLLSQSAFNRRVRCLAGVLWWLGPRLAAALRERLGPASFEVLDTVPVPLMRRCRGERHRLFGPEAAIGYGGADREWYYGVSVLVAIDAHGSITGFIEGPANTGAWWLAEALFRWRCDPQLPAPMADDLRGVLPPPHHGQRKGPTGPLGPRQGAGTAVAPVALADRGFRGRAWQDHWEQTYGVTVLTNRKATLPWCPMSRLRQHIEQTFAVLKSALGLAQIRARHYWGLLTRLAAKLVAFNLGVYWNALHDRPLHTDLMRAW